MEEAYESTYTIKDTKLYIFNDKCASFKMLDEKSVVQMFHRLNVIVNELRELGNNVDDEDLS